MSTDEQPPVFIKTIMVTIFRNYKEVDKPFVVSIEKVLNRIKLGGDGLKEQIERIRGLSGKEYTESKKQLSIACFNGEFDYRSKDGFKKGSGYFILDFDDLDNPEKRREEVEQKPFIYSVFTSPNGKDFKAVVRVPEIKSDYEYKVYFDLLKQEFPELDPTGKDISRACFFSYDPNIYINPAASIFKERKEKMKVKSWDNVNTALQKIEDAIEGEKHHIRTKIAYLFGGWVSNGDIGENEAMTLLSRSVAKNTNNFHSAMKSVEGCFQAGKLKPLSLSEAKNTLKIKTGLGKVYYHLDEVWDRVQNFIKEGYTKGMDVGWKALLDNYSMKRGSTTYVLGYPYSGKSQIFHEIYVNLAYEYGTNCVIFSPESGNVEHIYAELISIAMNKSIVGKKIDPSEFEDVSKFIRRKFWVIDPMGKEFDMKDMLSQVETIERSEETKIDIISIDPLNYLDLDKSHHRIDLAQAKDLDLFLADAKKNDRHNVIITHVRDIPPRQIKDRNKEVKYTYYPMPTPFDAANGQMFYRKGMMIVTMWRPLDTEGNPIENEEGKPYEKNESLFCVQKVKPKGTGKISQTPLYYDIDKNRYYEYINGYKSYAWQFKEQKKITTNSDFLNETPPPKQDIVKEEKKEVFSLPQVKDKKTASIF